MLGQLHLFEARRKPPSHCSQEDLNMQDVPSLSCPLIQLNNRPLFTAATAVRVLFIQVIGQQQKVDEDEAFD